MYKCKEIQVDPDHKILDKIYMLSEVFKIIEGKYAKIIKKNYLATELLSELNTDFSFTIEFCRKMFNEASKKPP